MIKNSIQTEKSCKSANQLLYIESSLENVESLKNTDQLMNVLDQKKANGKNKFKINDLDQYHKQKHSEYFDIEKGQNFFNRNIDSIKIESKASLSLQSNFEIIRESLDKLMGEGWTSRCWTNLQGKLSKTKNPQEIRIKKSIDEIHNMIISKTQEIDAFENIFKTSDTSIEFEIQMAEIRAYEKKYKQVVQTLENPLNIKNLKHAFDDFYKQLLTISKKFISIDIDSPNFIDFHKKKDLKNGKLKKRIKKKRSRKKKGVKFDLQFNLNEMVQSQKNKKYSLTEFNLYKKDQKDSVFISDGRAKLVNNWKTINPVKPRIKKLMKKAAITTSKRKSKSNRVPKTLRAKNLNPSSKTRRIGNLIRGT